MAIRADAGYPPRVATPDLSVTPSDDESQLIAALIAGRSEAFETLVRTHGGRMLTVATRFMRSEQDAADAVQDALLSVVKSIRNFHQGSKLSTWLHRIAVNACLMKLRSQRSKREVEIERLLPTFDETGHRTGNLRSWGEAADAGAITAETRQRVRACIDQLPASYREVLLLRDIEELDTDEVAAILKCTAGTIKTRLHRARQALRELLSPFVTGSLI